MDGDRRTSIILLGNLCWQLDNRFSHCQAANNLLVLSHREILRQPELQDLNFSSLTVLVAEIQWTHSWRWTSERSVDTDLTKKLNFNVCFFHFRFIFELRLPNRVKASHSIVRINSLWDRLFLSDYHRDFKVWTRSLNLNQKHFQRQHHLLLSLSAFGSEFRRWIDFFIWTCFCLGVRILSGWLPEQRQNSLLVHSIGFSTR